MSTTPRTDEVYNRQFAPEKPGITWYELSKQLETELARLRAQEIDYVKMIAEVLKCEPRSACEQSDNRIEAPWDVIARLRAEVERQTRRAFYFEKQLAEPANVSAERAEADTARLDWLSVTRDVMLYYPKKVSSFTPETFRAAIDAAMKEASK
jgi:hypothetical protein